jgi:hypothetical protein
VGKRVGRRVIMQMIVIAVVLGGQGWVMMMTIKITIDTGWLRRGLVRG